MSEKRDAASPNEMVGREIKEGKRGAGDRNLIALRIIDSFLIVFK